MIQIDIKPKAKYLPLQYQPIYKVTQILLILSYCTGNSKSASISLLHTIAWAMRDKENEKILTDFNNGKRKSLVPWCYEPALDKALVIAIVNSYCSRQVGGKIKLAKKGASLVQIIKKENFFKKEIRLLESIGTISETLISTKYHWEIK